MPDTARLPRITYTDVPADLEPIHAWFDTSLPPFRAGLGKTWPNVIGGRSDSDGAPYTAVSPIDAQITLGTYAEASNAAIDRAVSAARAAARDWGALPWRARVEQMRRFAQLLDEA